jgi:hypothetical protein
MLGIHTTKYKYSNSKGAHDKREALISQIPYDSYISQVDIEGDDRKEIEKELKALVRMGYLRKSIMYTSAKGKKMYRRVVG